MNWPAATPLRTEHFDLEPLTVEHAAELVDVLAPTGLYEFTGGEPPTLEALRARYERQSRGSSPAGDSGWLNWIIRAQDSGAAVGYVQATLIREEGVFIADLAWLVTPGEQRHGTATAAAAVMVAWLATQGVRRVRALIRADHEASSRVAQRIGLVPTSTVVEGELLWDAFI